jgi:hypothetical protein
MAKATRLCKVLRRQQRGLHLLLKLFSANTQLALYVSQPRGQR